MPRIPACKIEIEVFTSTGKNPFEPIIRVSPTIRTGEELDPIYLKMVELTPELIRSASLQPLIIELGQEDIQFLFNGLREISTDQLNISDSVDLLRSLNLSIDSISISESSLEAVKNLILDPSILQLDLRDITINSTSREFLSTEELHLAVKNAIIERLLSLNTVSFNLTSNNPTIQKNLSLIPINIDLGQEGVSYQLLGTGSFNAGQQYINVGDPSPNINKYLLLNKDQLLWLENNGLPPSSFSYEGQFNANTLNINLDQLTNNVIRYLAVQDLNNIQVYDNEFLSNFRYFNFNNQSILVDSLNIDYESSIGDGAEVYEGPGVETYRSGLYEVDVYASSNFQNAYVYSAAQEAYSLSSNNIWWASGSYPVISYLTFGVDTSTVVKVRKIGEPISSLDIGPYRLGVEYELSGGEARFIANRDERYYIVVNNNLSSPLCLFSDPPKPAIPSSGTVVYYGPGVHDIGFAFSSFSDNTTFYFDGGAYVKGSYYCMSSNFIKWIGPGILSCEDWYASAIADRNASNNNSLLMISSNYIAIRAPVSYNEHYNISLPSGLEIQGITIIQYPWHSARGINKIVNGKFISPWTYSTDGPVMIPDRSTSSCLVSSTFMFTFDDDIVLGGQNQYGNIIYKKCYFINGSNGPVVLTYDTPYFGPKVYGFSGIQCDVKYYGHYGPPPYNKNAIFKMYMGSNLSSAVAPDWGVFDYVFSGWNIEGLTHSPLFILMNGSDPFVEAKAYFSGATSGISFIDINYSGIPSVLSANYIAGHESVNGNEIRDILFKNVRINDKWLTRYNHLDYFTISGSTDIDEDRIFFVASAIEVTPDYIDLTKYGFNLDKQLVVNPHYLNLSSQNITTSSIGGDEPLLLDSISSTAYIAVSTRRLTTDYTGPLIRVRRSSDNTEQDIDFDSNGDLDVVSLSSFCGSNNGFITKWYNQGLSGTQGDFVQSTSSYQFQIFYSSSGVVRFGTNNRPAVKNETSGSRKNMTLSATNYNFTTNHSGHVVLNRLLSGVTEFITHQMFYPFNGVTPYVDGSSIYYFPGSWGPQGDSTNRMGNAPSLGAITLSGRRSSDSRQSYLNGVEASSITGNLTINSSDNYQLNLGTDLLFTTKHFDIGELIVFQNTLDTSEITTLHEGAAAYWGF